jgi:glycosyltransferase involved in cell wall biosynthesis
MRISFILSSLRLSGGVQVIVEYANRLAQRGHQIALVMPQDTVDADLLSELDSRVEARQSRVVLGTQPSLAGLLRLTWSMARTVPRSDVVISTHTPTTAVGWLTCKVLRRGRPVWLFQDYKEMFENRPYEAWLMRHALSWHECALVVSEDSRRELSAYRGGRVVVVGEGLSHPEIFCSAPADAGSRPLNQRTILFLGDMRPRKGLAEFLKAASLVYEHWKDIRLLIVSKERSQIESTVPFEYVHRPTRSELADLYRTCDLFVSASWREGFGVPPLEAMACAAPVVLTGSGGVREYARHEENCLMVPPRDPVALANAMLRVLTEPQVAERLRRNGPPTAARFTWEHAVDRFEHALNNLFPQT